MISIRYDLINNLLPTTDYFITCPSFMQNMGHSPSKQGMENRPSLRYSQPRKGAATPVL